MSKFVKQNLEEMKKGYTRVINGVAVTKWSEDVFEVGTWGRIGNEVDLESAWVILSNN